MTQVEAQQIAELNAQCATIAAGIEKAKKMLLRKMEDEFDDWQEYWDQFDAGCSKAVH